MKKILSIALLFLFPAVMISAVSCSKGVEKVEKTTVAATDDGAIVVDTVTIDATVTAIDLNKRKLTLTSADGGKTTYKAPPEMVNFDQLQIGDSVSAVVTEAVAVYLGASAPPDAVAAGGVMLAPVGSKPGGFVTEVEQVTLVVVAVDMEKRKVTFELPDGSTKKVKVKKDVNLSGVVAGETVTVVMGAGLAIEVTTP